MQEYIESRNQVVVAEYHKATSTGGGQATANAWTTYPLSHLVINDENIAAFNATNVNDIDLPPGVYEIRDGRAMFLHWLDVNTRIINVASSAIICQGFSDYSRQNGDELLWSRLHPSRFLLTVKTSIRMQYFVNGVLATASDANDLGYPLNGLVTLGFPNELYGDLYIVKIG